MKKKKKKLKKIDNNIIKNSKYFIPKLIKYNTYKTNSWFEIKEYNYSNINIEDTIIPKWFYPENNDKILRAKQVYFYPNIKQRYILLNWLELSRIIYNLTVKFLRKNKLQSFIKIRPLIKNIFSNSLKKLIKKYNLPAHIADNSINDVIKAYKSAIALLKAKEIKHFVIRYKKKNKPNQTIVIEKGDFSSKFNSFYVNSLGKEDLNIDYNIKKENLKCDVRLTYNTNKNRFILNIPEYKNIKNSITHLTCALDAGSNSFLTLYNPNGKAYKLGTNNNKLSNLIEKKVKLKNKIKLKKYKKYEKRINRKLNNLVKELHYKIANYICSHFDNILLGKLSTKSITSKNKNLCSREKRLQYQLSHDKFRNILKNKAKEYNKNVIIVDESYTSKTLGCCGNEIEVKNKREVECTNCKIRLDRDINASRNILIKNQQLLN